MKLRAAMIALRDYGLWDWRHLRPVTHAYKTIRYRVTDSLFLRRRARAGDIRGVRKAAHGRHVLVTVAFGDAQCLGIQLRLTRGLVHHDLHIVADNSVSDAAACENKRVCDLYGVPYVRLPANPWTVKNPSRSHGAALNWIWHNVLKPARPTAFGFLDQDLFPTLPCDPFEPLGRVAFYGDIRRRGPRWFLWAGYCFFRFAAVEHKAMDFGPDWFPHQLDTGGANWKVLYRYADLNTLPQRPVTAFPVLPGIDLGRAYCEWRGDWLHEVGLDGDLSLRAMKRDAVLRLVESVSVHQT